MLIAKALAATDYVMVFKTAAVVVVAIAFLAVVVRALGSRPSAMRKGAHLPLDDPHRADQASAEDSTNKPTGA